ncbi:MAG: hypothetical protein IJ137_12145 [Eubacterium sp.]|nr:hypothetical protein [Eubacterium sp.]
MVRDDLKIAVSTAVRECRLMRKKVTYDAIPLEIIPGKSENIAITVSPVMDKKGERTDYTAVIFVRGKRDLTLPVKGDIIQVNRGMPESGMELSHQRRTTLW